MCAAPTTPPGWPDLDGLPGVADAVAAAREAIATVQRLPVNRRGWPRTAAAAAIRTARASAMLDGGHAKLDDSEVSGVVSDPILAGALRVSAATAELAGVWPRAPLQALARLHTLAAADLVPREQLGRPRSADGVSERLAMLAQTVTAAAWSGPVMVAIVHGELLGLSPFGSADGVVARGAARLAMVATGLDPQALTAPDVGYLRAGNAYRQAAAKFATGTPQALATWITHVCDALKAGAKEAKSVARAADEYHRSAAGHAERHRHSAAHRHR